jgi:putative nucleotidyltransferase with HDIG domain
MRQEKEVLAYLESQEEIKTAPSLMVDILNSIFKDQVSTVRKKTTMGRDPGLTTRMLRVADLSSTSSGINPSAKDTESASAGINGSRMLILSIAVYNQLSELGYTGVALFSDVWRHSLETANAAQAIACRIDPSLAEMAYVCGLLHDLGLIVLLRHFPEEASNVRDEVIGGAELLGAERRIIGSDHQDVGLLVAEKWNMPGVLRDVIGNHHPADRDFEAGTSPLSLMTVVADGLSPVYRESERTYEANGTEEEIMNECCVRLGISIQEISGIYSILPNHMLRTGNVNDAADDIDAENCRRMSNELFGLYSGLASMFRERREISRRLLRERYVEGTRESLSIALSTISHYINNSMSVISGESEILRHVFEQGDKEAALARIPEITRAIAKTSKKIAVLLDELSSIAGPDELQFFKNSKAIDIKKSLEERLETETRMIT